MISALREQYSLKKKDIKKRLKDFEEVWGLPDRRIFAELCFCICTPQSKAVMCDRAVTALAKSGDLYTGALPRVRAGLKGVRFPNNKAGFILKARELFSVGGKIMVKAKIDTENIPAARDWIVRNVKGLGYKEASHFLRNIGFGRDLAILDVHILRNMKRYGVVRDVPKSLGAKRYFELEGKLKKFAGRTGIPLGELDLLFWSAETGEIFK
jgi:N-glycosylase/DNA lyase